MTPLDDLSQRLASLELNHAFDPLMLYLNLLLKWNNTYNLTAIRELPQMITHHIHDSLAILPWVKGSRLLDVGTGAGLPGIPLAIANPSLQVVLLDSNGKKIRFLNEVKRKLGLNHVKIVQSRAEAYRPSSSFDTVTSRAVSELKHLIDWTQPVIAEQGQWLAMKGRYPEAELTALHHHHRVESYTVPGIEGDRCCVIVTNEIKE